MDPLRPIRSSDRFQQRHRGWDGPDGGDQEVRQRPGRQPREVPLANAPFLLKPQTEGTGARSIPANSGERTSPNAIVSRPRIGVTAKPRAQQSRRARRDDCIARAMRKPDRTKLPAVAALLLSSDLRLLVRHALRSLAHPAGRLPHPGDAQAESRYADGSRRAAAFRPETPGSIWIVRANPSARSPSPSGSHKPPSRRRGCFARHCEHAARQCRALSRSTKRSGDG